LFPVKTGIVPDVGDRRQTGRLIIKNQVSVMLVDDHAVVREGYRRLLERGGDIAVIGEAARAASRLFWLRDEGERTQCIGGSHT
jgi:hypothetical protein